MYRVISLNRTSPEPRLAGTMTSKTIIYYIQNNSTGSKYIDNLKSS